MIHLEGTAREARTYQRRVPFAISDATPVPKLKKATFKSKWLTTP